MRAGKYPPRKSTPSTVSAEREEKVEVQIQREQPNVYDDVDIFMNLIKNFKARKDFSYFVI